MAKIYSERELEDLVVRAAEYPNVDKAAFSRSYFLDINRVQGTHAINEIAPDTITVEREKWRDGDDVKGYERMQDIHGNDFRGIHLDGAHAPVPAYCISALGSDGKIRTLNNRIAILAYGSNSSPDVLRKKFSGLKDAFWKAVGRSTGEDWQVKNRLHIAVVSATIDDHIVACGAFAGAIGSNPATLMQYPGARSTVTIGFFDQSAANKMVSTEPNYNASLLRKPVGFASGISVMPIVWDSIWGARIDTAPATKGKPIAYGTIPMSLEMGAGLRQINGQQALEEIIKEGTGVDLSRLSDEDRAAARAGFTRQCVLGRQGRAGVAVDEEDSLNTRLDVIEKLQQNRFAPNLDADVIVPADIAQKSPRAAAIIKDALSREAALQSPPRVPAPKAAL